MVEGPSLGQQQQQPALLLEPLSTLAGNKPWVVRSGEKLTVGRKAECNVVVNDNIVSGHHCTVGLSILPPQERQGDGIVISVEDKSTNGTLINGEKIGKGKTRYLRGGEILNLGKPKATTQGEQQYAASFKLRMVTVDSGGRWHDTEKENKSVNEDAPAEGPVATPASTRSAESSRPEVPKLRNFPVNSKRTREPPTALRRREGKASSGAAMAAAHREEQLRSQLATSEESRRKEEARATELEIRVRVTEERLKSLTEQLEEARRSKDRYQEENTSLQNQVAELTIRGKQLEAAAESRDRALQDAQRDAGMRTEDMENLRAEAFDADARAREASRRLREIKRNLGNALEANRSLVDYSNELRQKVRELQSALTASVSSGNALQNAISTLFKTAQEHTMLDASKVEVLLRPAASPPSSPRGVTVAPTETYEDEDEDQTDTDNEVEDILTNAATVEEDDGDVTPRPYNQLRIKQSDSDSDTSGQDGTETPPPTGKRMRSSCGGSPSSQKRLRKDDEEEKEGKNATFGDLLGNHSE
ncbi:hypothetical protein FOL47_010141 [Perkinsus chesapeaki]|uniref:FHA domain-containing protein n=1 Tax=Perkinsus chesapeaki TaxID=330153 RepID=A0A7J6MS20_PERCH|nr:hypothetical protein FOL47_010141 [Perkinsus chesapeaki]